MKKKNLLLFSLLVCGLTVYAQMPPPLLAFLKNKNVAHAAVSFKAINLSTGECVVSYNENMSLIPASNMKLITTATALEILGARFYFETPLSYDGSVKDTILEGNLYIKGNGDPTLGSEFMDEDRENFLKKWLSAINSAGIRKINGNIVVLDQLFGYDGVSSRWLWEDMGTYYAPGVYGISVFDNMYRVYVKSSEPDSPTTVLYTEPAVFNLNLTNEIVASGDHSDGAYAFGIPFDNDMRLYGTIPALRSSYELKGAIPDPGSFLAHYFRYYLQKNGIEVAGEATTYRLNRVTPSEEKLLSSVRSADLASIIETINVKSMNLYAEHLFKMLTVLDTIDIQGFWKTKGLDSDALFMYDGSGISPKNAVSAAFLIDLLVYMDKQSENSDSFSKSLPVSGRTGTIASFLRNTALDGKARLKSGSMSNVQSYSGYVESKGKRYAVSLIINNFTGERTDLRKDIEELFNGLF